MIYNSFSLIYLLKHLTNFKSYYVHLLCSYCLSDFVWMIYRKGTNPRNHLKCPNLFLSSFQRFLALCLTLPLQNNKVLRVRYEEKKTIIFYTLMVVLTLLGSDQRPLCVGLLNTLLVVFFFITLIFLLWRCYSCESDDILQQYLKS